MTLEEIENLKRMLRAGDRASVLAKLKNVISSDVPRRFLSDFVDVLRQADQWEKAISLLNGVVRPSGGKTSDATPKEITIYAASLIKAGAWEEGATLLKQVGPKDYPDSLLFRAHAFFSHWNYSEAVPVLKEYLQNPTLAPEKRVIGTLNLVAALIVESNFSEAEPLLSWLDSETATLKLNLFRAISHELAAQMSILQKKWEQAKIHLDKGQEVLGSDLGLEAFFLRKWRLILEVRKSSDFKTHQTSWQRLYRQAEQLEHWESVRDLDNVRATTLHDKELLYYLHFGTPFESFRKKLFKSLKKPLELPSRYAWRLGEGKAAAKTFDMMKLVDSGKLKPNSQAFRLLQVLCSDFYRPFRMGTLFSELYPGEYFNPDSSPPRVYQAIATLREFFEERKMPLSANSEGQGYRLAASAPCEIILGRAQSAGNRNALSAIRGKLPQEGFVAQDVCEILGCSRATAGRLLSSAVAENEIIKTGSGSGTRYYFPESSYHKLASNKS